ncbi:4a-hydroxytetrahydrobiopterin dehydratase [Glutamicibacter sp. TV12E]|uniref:4a-hydroxytetrahydrobiopterin dehydratase n=1 Tax=Glutamicibacter sp. TV12E TaxID=3446362 RepID=UPI0040337B3F
MTNIRQISRAQSPVSLAPEQRLAALQEWKRSNESFTASYRFDSTGTALEFITLVGLLAEKVDVHPHVDWRFDIVTLHLAHGLNTGITAKDLSLARRISVDAHRLNGAVMVDYQDRQTTA